MLDAEGHIKVTDFGLAKLVQDGARHNSLVGTVDYMAPEIVTGRGHGMARLHPPCSQAHPTFPC